MLCHWCFWFTMNALVCEAWKTEECMDEKGVMVEEWKARRKEWKKKRRKKGKREKWFWEKSFLFLFLFDCVFASSLFPCINHTTTHAHTHPPHTTQHDALVHTITRKQGHVLCCFFWEWTARHTAPFTPLTPSLDITQHTPTNQPNRHNPWFKQRDDKCQ